MKTKSLEILQKSRLPVEQATAILEVMELELGQSRDDLREFWKTDLDNAVTKLEMKIDVRLAEERSANRTWMFSAFLTQTGILAAMGYFALTRLVH